MGLLRRASAVRIALVVSALLLSTSARAVEVGDGKLIINGNGAWSYERTDENVFGFADPDGEYSTSMFDLVLTARPSDELVVSAQMGFDQHEIELHWAFAEYRLHDLARVRAGKVKQPLGNYGELQFVGTARPFFDLATGVYGPANVTAESYYGLGVTGERLFGSSGYGLQYDAYGGALDLPVYEGFDVLEPGYVPGAEAIEDEVEEVENIVGGRLSLLTPWDVTFRLSGYGGRMEKDEEGEGAVTFLVYGASAGYQGERLWVSAEAFRSVESGFEDQLSAYVEAAYFVLPKVQLAARYERVRVDMEETVDDDSPLLKHDEWGVGVNYWFTPQLVLKASYQDVTGQRFARLDEDADELSNRTRRFVGGVQFTF